MARDLYCYGDREAHPWSSTVAYSESVTTNGPLIFTAGQGPFDDQGDLIAPGDPAAQIRATYANLRTVLERAGGSLDGIVSQTVYLQRPEDLPVFVEVRQEFLKDPQPAVTTVRADLLVPGMLIELTAVATRGVGRTTGPTGGSK
ncbi:RidA family protein [Jiangella alba]|uniref:RidA family protein n=1 Tax=Jiangella alba TaxID=561176 RepID=UPI00083EE369|nr:RidA family protein [Jiangella alba]